jgi:5-methylcytosine-specific restriction endonuclease McrA
MGALDGIIERDGGACVWCGREPWRRDLTAEHLLPRSRGGRTTPENLAVACRPCNRRRRSAPVSAYVRSLARAGRAPAVERVRAAMERLAASATPAHAAYGRRQAALLERL